LGDKILEWLSGVFTHPAKTLNEISAARPLGWALLIFLGVALLNALSSSANLQTEEVLDQFMFTTGLTISTPLMIVGTLVIAILYLFISTGIIHPLARLFKGTGGYGGMLSAFAFASFPQIIAAPVNVLTGFIGMAGSILGGLITFGLSVWVLVLQVIAVRESHQLTTGMSILVYLIYFLIVVVIPLALIIGLVAYFIFI